MPPEARASTYRFLARLTLSEVDLALADSLRQLPVFGPTTPCAGGDHEAFQALRAEYTRTFLMNVHPYESVYLDEAGMLNTSQSGSVLAHYREHGFEPPSARSTGAPDHLGLELEFMAHLIDREAAARRTGGGFAEALRADQVHFLESHLLRWAPSFGAVLAETATSDLYRVLGEVLQGFLLGDHETLVAEGRPGAGGS